jgi:sugar phosphate isomerase/epimerase
MLRVISTYLYVNQKLGSALLAELESAGMSGVEIFCDRAHFDYRAPEQVRMLESWFGAHRLKLHALHSPTSRDFTARRESHTPISISDPERVRRLDAVDEVKRALEVAERVPYRYLVQHLGASREGADPRRYDAAFNSLEHLSVFAKQRGVTIALENTPGELAAAQALRTFVSQTRLTDLRFCFDSGHAHMEEGVAGCFEAMRDLVVTTHLHDNHGERDEHLLPFEGSIDWPAALKALAHVPAAPEGLPMVLELKDSGARAIPLEEMKAVFARFAETWAAAKAG